MSLRELYDQLSVIGLIRIEAQVKQDFAFLGDIEIRHTNPIVDHFYSPYDISETIIRIEIIERISERIELAYAEDNYNQLLTELEGFSTANRVLFEEDIAAAGQAFTQGISDAGQSFGEILERHIHGAAGMWISVADLVLDTALSTSATVRATYNSVAGTFDTFRGFTGAVFNPKEAIDNISESVETTVDIFNTIVEQFIRALGGLRNDGFESTFEDVLQSVANSLNDLSGTHEQFQSVYDAFVATNDAKAFLAFLSSAESASELRDRIFIRDHLRQFEENEVLGQVVEDFFEILFRVAEILVVWEDITDLKSAAQSFESETPGARLIEASIDIKRWEIWSALSEFGGFIANRISHPGVAPVVSAISNAAEAFNEFRQTISITDTIDPLFDFFSEAPSAYESYLEQMQTALATYGGRVGPDWARDLFVVQNVDPSGGEFIGSEFDENITGSSVRDLIFAGDGNDLIFGEEGIDVLRGESGNDTIYGGDLGDEIFGDQNDDSIRGEAGNDTIKGGPGDDTLYGDQGNDTLEGEQGVDKLIGGPGRDVLVGGQSADRFVLETDPDGSIDTILDYNQGGTGVYSQYEGDTLDISELVGPEFSAGTNWQELLRLMPLSSGSGSRLEVNRVASVGGWETIAYLEGVMEGHTVGLTLIPESNSQQALVRVGHDTPEPVSGDWTITPSSQSTDENDGQFLTFEIERPDDQQSETVYVSTVQTYGSQNVNDYDPLLNQAVTFDAGQSRQTVRVVLQGDNIPEPNETFGLIVQSDQDHSVAQYLASASFEIRDQTPSVSELTDEDDYLQLNWEDAVGPYYGLEGDDTLVLDLSDSDYQQLYVSWGDRGALHFITDRSQPESREVVTYQFESFEIIAGDGDESISPNLYRDWIVRGNGGDDTITGALYGHNTLFGGPGSDSLRGYGGDILDGGEGFDTANVSVRRGFLEANHFTFDQNQSEYHYLPDGTVLRNIESLSFSADRSNAFDDHLTYRFNEDFLYEVAGVYNEPILNLGLGNDQVTLDFSRFSTSLETITSSSIASLWISTVHLDQGGHPGVPGTRGTTFAQVNEVERFEILGGNGDDRFVLAQGLGADTLWGGDGNDELSGGVGQDILLGGDGDDTLIAGSSADILDGGSGIDIVELDRSDSEIAFDIVFEDGLGGLQILEDTTILREVERLGITTGEQNDSFSLFLSNELSGLLVNIGRSVVDLGGGSDTAILDGSSLERSILVSAESFNGEDIQWLNYSVEGNYYRGEFHGSENFTFLGGSGDDRVYGSDLGEHLNTGDGHDWVHSRDGDDTIIGGRGNDTVDGGLGQDEYRFTGSFESYAVQQGESQGSLKFVSAHQTDLISNVEVFVFSDREHSFAELEAIAGREIIGSSHADTLEGGAGDDTIGGVWGDNLLRGFSGDDLIWSGGGHDIIDGGPGNDTLIGGQDSSDLRDVIYGGAGNDSIDGGYGNDELRGDAGNDTIAGGFGADTVIGGTGHDTLTGSAFADQVFGGDGDDFVNGGFGHDLVNGGAGADRFFHIGIFNHGSDWIQDYNAAEGDVLQFGIATATRSQFQINTAHTATAAGERSGDDNVEEAFVIYRPTGQIMWALVDGASQSSVNLQVGSNMFDLLA
ncbi:Cyclolysin [Shimia thalassica]|uniref:Cyclolysin n=1 Tax=Shimia thalassica TaxID=1715693 RepID=A0A0P1IKQ0_9RHOB|nr:Calx-beta domain-containing protein [Shimia thalassica]CUK08340.1 Cyclolysin [Shimia thalassica]